jgi:hypothetical protein
VGILCDYTHNKDQELEELKYELRYGDRNTELYDKYQREYWTIISWATCGLEKVEQDWEGLFDWKKEFNYSYDNPFGERFRSEEIVL